MIHILLCDQINDDEWQHLVDRSVNASYFQTKACYDFYCQLSFLKPFLYAVSENGQLKALVCGYVVADGGMVKSFFSRRAIAPGGVLLDESVSEQALTLLLTTLKRDLTKQAIYIEIRNYTNFGSFRNSFEKCKFSYQSHLNFHVKTSDADSVFKQLSATKRRQIKQTEKLGVKCFETNDVLDIHAFYGILKSLHDKKIKTPLFPVEFFEKLILNSSAKLFVVKNDKAVLGGIVCALLPGRAVYEWFVCGEEMPETNIYPSTLATWTAIRYTAEHEYQYFDFMGAGKPNEDYGVRDFKAKFGGKLVEHGRFLYICNNFLYAVGKAVVETKRKL